MSAWRQREWEKVRSKLGHPIPCIEYKLETLTRLRITRIEEHALREFYSPLSETLEDAKKSPLLAKALGSKKKAEEVADAILKWFEFMKDSIPLINHIIVHAFTIDICLWVYQSIGNILETLNP